MLCRGGAGESPCLNYPKISSASLSGEVLFFGEVKEPACIVLIFISQVSGHRLLPQPLSSPLICVGVSARRLEESVKSTGLELQMVVNCRVDPGS